jgi:hypothetical protein
LLKYCTYYSFYLPTKAISIEFIDAGLIEKIFGETTPVGHDELIHTRHEPIGISGPIIS